MTLKINLYALFLISNRCQFFDFRIFTISVHFGILIYLISFSNQLTEVKSGLIVNKAGNLKGAQERSKLRTHSSFI